MEPVTRDVRDIHGSDREALERIVGRPLRESQRLVIRVEGDEPAPESGGQIGAGLPDWANVYEGLTDAEIDELDAAIRVRANLTRPEMR